MHDVVIRLVSNLINHLRSYHVRIKFQSNYKHRKNGKQRFRWAKPENKYLYYTNPTPTILELQKSDTHIFKKYSIVILNP